MNLVYLLRGIQKLWMVAGKMDFTITFNQAIALIIGTGILVGTLFLFGWKNKDKKEVNDNA